MWFPFWLRKTITSSSHRTDRASRRRGARPRRARPTLEWLEDRLTPSAGQLDPTFGQGGIAANNIGGPTQTSAKAVIATQSDGKVIVVGESEGYNNFSSPRIAVVRYNGDGTLDNSFGTGGEVTFNFAKTVPYNFNDDSPAGVAIDASGNILVAGTTNTSNGQEFAVARLTSAGQLDTSFGSGGTALVDIPYVYGYSQESASGLAIDGAGRIVVAGTAWTTNGKDFAVARLTSTGSLDTSFGSGGETTIAFGGGGSSDYDEGAGVAIDSSGNIVVAGTANGNATGSWSGYLSRFAVARLNAAGNLDQNFGSGGETTISPFSAAQQDFDTASGVTLDSTGNIVVAGTTFGESFNQSYTFYPDQFAVARLSSSGSLDPSFGNGGKTTISYPGSYAASAAGLAIDASNRVIVAGTTASTNSNGSAFNSMAVTRLDGSGNLDTSWNGTGLATANFSGPSNDSASNMTLTQPDGKIVVVGTSSTATGDVRLAVERYNPDGTLDSTFGNGGTALFGYGSGLFVSPDAVSIDGSGRLLIAGKRESLPLFNYGDSAVLRLNTDGSPDTSFGTGGVATVHFNSYGYYSSSTAMGVAVDAAGNIVLTATETDYNFGDSDRIAVARLTANGSLDTNFGTGGEVILNYTTPGANSTYEDDEAAGVAIDSAGHIIVAGTSFSYTYTPYPYFFSSNGTQFAVARLNSDGSLDNSFGSGGKTTINFSGGYDFDNVVGMGIDPSGQIIVAGSTGNIYSGISIAVAKLNAADGSLDQSFGTGGKATLNNFGYAHYDPTASRMAIDSAGRIAVVGDINSEIYPNDYGLDFAAVLFKANGCPDVDFGTDGTVVTPVGSSGSGYSHDDIAAGAAFDSAGRLVVAGTVSYSNYGDSYHGPSNFAVIRYLPHDSVVEAGSATFASDLQAAVTALQTTPPLGTPQVVIHVANQTQMAAVGPALAGLSVNPSGPNVQILLDANAGSYSLGAIAVPAGLTLLIDGDGGSPCEGTFASSSGPVLTQVSGNVIIRGGASFSETGNSSAIVVQGGQLTMRNSTVTETTTTNQAAIAIRGGQVDLGASYSDYGNNTISMNGPGVLIRLTGPNNVMAVGDNFVVNGNYLYDNYQIENEMDHSLDGFGPGTVFWAPNNVFVTTRDGSVQAGVNVVPSGGTVNVQTGVTGPFYVGSKLLTIAYGYGYQTVTQQADTLDPTKLELLFQDFSGNGNIKFVAGTSPGQVQMNINNLPRGTFLPTGRLIAYAGYGDNIGVDSTLTLSAWLYGAGNCRLKGGGGNNVLIGSGSGDLLAGGSARDLIIGYGGDRLVSNGGEDILLAGSTIYDNNEVALGAILAEWTSSDSLATRVADLTDNTASPYFTANGLNGNYFLIASGSNETVFSDYSADTITAGSGPDLVFYSSTDKVTGLTADDIAFIENF